MRTEHLVASIRNIAAALPAADPELSEAQGLQEAALSKAGSLLLQQWAMAAGDPELRSVSGTYIATRDLTVASGDVSRGDSVDADVRAARDPRSMVTNFQVALVPDPLGL